MPRFTKCSFTMTGPEISLLNACERGSGASVNRKIEPWAELREQIIAHGWNHKATGRVVSEVLINLAIALAGIWIFVVFDGLVVVLARSLYPPSAPWVCQPIPTHH